MTIKVEAKRLLEKCFGYKQDNQYLHTLYLNRLCTDTFVGKPDLFDHSPAHLELRIHDISQSVNNAVPFILESSFSKKHLVCF